MFFPLMNLTFFCTENFYRGNVFFLNNFLKKKKKQIIAPTYINNDPTANPQNPGPCRETFGVGTYGCDDGHPWIVQTNRCGSNTSSIQPQCAGINTDNVPNLGSVPPLQSDNTYKAFVFIFFFNVKISSRFANGTFNDNIPSNG